MDVLRLAVAPAGRRTACSGDATFKHLMDHVLFLAFSTYLCQQVARSSAGD
jgi:isopentenyldiphosphate isomerase